MHAVNEQTTFVRVLSVSALFKAVTSWDKMLPESDLKRQNSQFFSLYDKDRKVKREEASFSLNTAKSDGGEKEMMETVVEQE